LPQRIEPPPVTSPPPIAHPPKKKRRGVTLAVIASVIVLILLLKFCGGGSTPDGNFRAKPKGFTLEQLAAATQTLYGQWVEDDVLVDDYAEWSGTTAAVNLRDGKLVLITNSHCLDLNGLADADSSKNLTRRQKNSPEVKDYSLSVEFPSGKKRPVLRMAETPRPLDLAFLEVDASGLQEGVDYIIISVGNEQYKIGDDVVAVGSPLDLAGTHTFGKVSAIRDIDGVRHIQHHAELNPGNSGGPLFLKTKSGRYVWIGVNTQRRGNGLGLAIDANEAFRAKYEWVPANKHGAAAVIQKMYGQPNTTVVE